jgi:hypothetical protein
MASLMGTLVHLQQFFDIYKKLVLLIPLASLLKDREKGMNREEKTQRHACMHHLSL